MKGSLRQRSPGSWELRVYAGTDPSTGARRWLSRTVRGSRHDAQRKLVELAEHANIAPAVGSRTTVAELLDPWFARGCGTWSPVTVRNTRSIIDRYLKPGLGDLLVGELTTAGVDAFYTQLRQSGGLGGKPLGVGTVRRVHSVLSSALSQAERWSWVFDNVASRAKPPRSEPVEMRPPTIEQVVELLVFLAERDPLLHLYVCLAAMTGARRGQLLALRWGDIDLVRGTVSIHCSIVEGPDGPVLAPTKSKRAYMIALDVFSLELLRARHRGVIDPSRDRFVFALEPTGEKPWLPNYVTKRFIDARRRAGLPHFRLHDLRHFMSTEMLRAGVQIATVSRRLDHSKKSITLDVYSHAVPGGDEEAAEILRQRLAAVNPAMFAVPTAPGEIRHPSDIPGGDPNRWVSLDLEKSDAVALFEWLSVLTVRDCRLSPNEGGYVAVSNLISELERVVVAPSSVGVANGQPTLIAGSPPSD